MTLLDAVWLVSTAAIGLGLFELTHRTLFNGWIWLLDLGIGDISRWSTMRAIVMMTDITVLMLPVVFPWTLLLIALRMRPPRPSWRRVWRQPGMAGCLAALFGCLWSVGVLMALIASMELGILPRPSKTITADVWAQKFLSEEVFMYAGLAVAAVWLLMCVTGRWRKSYDWIDFLGRIIGALWIVIGLVWTLHEYYEFV